MSERRGFVPDLPVLTRSIETFDEYVEKAMRTLNPELTRKRRERHAISGLISELGEVCGLVQKIDQGHTLDPVHMCKELGDCAWFFADIVDMLYLNPATIAFEAAKYISYDSSVLYDADEEDVLKKCKECNAVTIYEGWARSCTDIDPIDGYIDEWGAWRAMIDLIEDTRRLVNACTRLKGYENQMVNAAANWLMSYTMVCYKYGITLHEVLLTNINKLEKRYPDGFETKRSKVRAEGDV